LLELSYKISSDKFVAFDNHLADLYRAG